MPDEKNPLAPAVPYMEAEKSGNYTVTPEIADRWLQECNPKNRHLRYAQVDHYAEAMMRGEWELNGEPLIFTNTLLLCDGQHRLAACVMSELPLTTFIIFGVDPAFAHTIDVGIRRTGADQLSLLGHKNAHNLASTLHLLSIYLHDSSLGGLAARKGALTPAQRGQLLEQYPRIEKSVSFASARAKTLTSLAPTSQVAIFHFILSEKHSEEKVALFFEKLSTGAGLDVLDPILRYRNYIMGIRDKGHSPNPRIRLALLVKTWNAWNAGRSLRSLTWRTPSHPEESFPIIS